MTYTAYPYFTAWHEVLDWASYSDPPFLDNTAARPQRQPFFDQLRSYWGDLITLSGGTPAVLEAGGGSFLAVARAKAYAACFHVGASAWAAQMPPLGCSMALTCEAFRHSIFAAVPSERPLFRDRIPFVPSFAYRPLDGCQTLNSSAAWEALARAVEARNSSAVDKSSAGAAPAPSPDLQAAAAGDGAALHDAAMDARHRKPVAHHQYDFFMVLYRFSATPPYTITHVSPGFMPPTAVHSGVVFPLGLSRIAAPGGAAGASQHYLVSYGEDDMAARAMVMSEATVEALLRPVEDILEGLPDFAACTVPAAHFQ
ncbi:hypothetical protein HYH03_015760 [Edaphochlamys debaryana]|uniref:Uncharacterized protein n=1 Tax=Edaphochlamys debaryana TaxID=47281 RepID=A0A836BQJ7_9CHLO|nr:hypothetical protein HYH03_015760 [Edaphochlamys debaryana]|eukprot:KAG2485486.1 hypothetical protein HYH03_015760 [Edaphochlamys debaryana]